MRPLVRVIVTIMAAVGLTGCFQSQQALFPPETGITPMPANFALIATDANNKIVLESKGEVQLMEFAQQGKSYYMNGAAYTFSRIPDRSQYIVQAPAKDGQKTLYRYAVVDVHVGRVLVHNFPDTSNKAFVELLEKAGVRFIRNGLFFEFPDRANLTEAARLASASQNLQEPGHFRILTSSAEATAAGEEVRAARAALGIVRETQRGGGAQPPASSAPPAPVAPPIEIPQPHRDALRRAQDEPRAMSAESMLFFGGAVQEIAQKCGLNGSPSERAALALFIKSASERAMLGGNYSDPSIGDMMRKNVAGTSVFAAGIAFARTLNCSRPVVDGLTRDVLKAVQRAQSGADGGVSPFVKTCTGRYSATQCSCIAQVGQAVIPGIHQMAFDRSIISRIIQGSPLVALQIPMMCGVQNY